MSTPDSHGNGAPGMPEPSTTSVNANNSGGRPAKRPKLNNRSNENDNTHHKSVVTRRKVACETCRGRKIRCSQERPRCAYCSASDSECIYIETPEDKLTLDPVTKLVISRLDQILHSVDGLRSGMDQLAPVPHHLSPPKAPQSDPGPQQEPENIIFTKDYLTIPSGQTSADAVLTWPVFHSRYPPDILVRLQYMQSEVDPPLAGTIDRIDPDTRQPLHHETLLDPRSVPGLVDSFLRNVHTKNPVLNVRELLRSAQSAAQHGIGWDAKSCLLLTVCALGCISRPFADSMDALEQYESFDPTNAFDRNNENVLRRINLSQGELYFTLASHRIGMLKHTMLGSQCHFYAAVYLMYTFRPLRSWTHFYQSSSLYQFHLRSVGGPTAEDPYNYDLERLQSMNRQARRLEQTLYWSCFKSEVELRVELPLAQSTIASFEYPSMFPTPPTPQMPSPTSGTFGSGSSGGPSGNSGPTGLSSSAFPGTSSPWHQVLDATYGHSLREFRVGTESSGSEDSTHSPLHAFQGPRSHNGAPYNEEESWYYYLTEVALRRISNRVVNAFHRDSRDSWLQPEKWVALATEFDTQIASWAETLPAAIQTSQASPMRQGRHMSISTEFSLSGAGAGGAQSSTGFQSSDAPSAGPGPLSGGIGNGLGSSFGVGGGGGGSMTSGGDYFTRQDSVSRELGWCTENRLLEMRSWLYQPALYCRIHQSRLSDGVTQPWTLLPQNQSLPFRKLVSAGIECNLKILHWRALLHRHHGTWFDIRAVFCAIVTLCALARGNPSDVPFCLFLGSEDARYQPDRSCGKHMLTCINFDTVFARLQYWEDETVDVRPSRILTQELVEDTRRVLVMGQAGAVPAGGAGAPPQGMERRLSTLV